MSKRLMSPVFVSLFMVLILLSLALTLVSYWFLYVKPEVLADSKTQLSAVATVQAEQLARELEQEPERGVHGGNEQELDDYLNRLMLYVYEVDQEPLFVALQLDLDPFFASENKLSEQHAKGYAQCRNCYQRDYPLYSSGYDRLLGVVRFYMPMSRIDRHVENLQQMFLTGMMIVLAVVAIAAWLGIQLMYRLKQWTDDLSDEVQKRTQSLENEVKQHAQTQEALSRVRDETVRLERARIASNLHDGVGQSLQALKLGLQMQASQAGEHERGPIKELVGDVGQAISVVRDFCAELKPLHLEKMTLSDALYNFIERLGQRVHGVELVSYFEDEQHSLSLLEKEQLFLIATELVNNALKHSLATRIDVALLVGPKRCVLRVKDNGVGIDEKLAPDDNAGAYENTDSRSTAERAAFQADSDAPSSRSGLGGLGLHLVHERCERIGASFFFEDQHGRYQPSEHINDDLGLRSDVNSNSWRTGLPHSGTMACCVLEYSA